jgi:hypothetical protein
VVAFAVGARPISTREPTVVVDPLPAGEHVFRLVVVDDAGLRSEPVEAVVTVVGRLRPVAPPAPPA